MTTPLADKARRFRDLHAAGKPFVMPNAWDVASARLLAARGFPAIATTSAGINWAHGLPDGPGAASRDLTLARHGAIARAVDLPVNGDLENGYGDAPEQVAACIRCAIDEGCVGAGIEDFTGDRQQPYYDIGLAAERIAAARAAADASGIAFTLTARAECFLYGHDDPLDEAIRRLRRYREAGADCLYAPGPTDDETVRRLVGETGGPLNVVVEQWGGTSVASMANLGVARISTGGKLFRSAYGRLAALATEMAEAGTFSFADDILSDEEIESAVSS